MPPASYHRARACLTVTRRVDINSAMASTVNVLGLVHGCTGKQALVIYRAIDEDPDGEPM